MQVDPAFHGHRQRARIRQRWRWIRLGTLALTAVTVVGLAAWALWPGGSPVPAPVAGTPATDQPAGAATGDPDDPQMVQVEDAFDIAPVVRADTFTDIPGDPLVLTLAGTGGSQREKDLAGPPTLDVGRVGLPAPDRLKLLQEPLVMRERRLMTALPSTREDFALFQSQRGRSLQIADDGPPAPIDPLLQLEEAAPAAPTSSTIFVRAEDDRQPLSEEIILDLERDAPLSDLLADNGFGDEVADRLAEEAGPVLQTGDKLPAGSVLAVRYAPEGDAPQLLQMSLYGPEGWKGSVARVGRGELVEAADPWLDQNILRLAHGENGDGSAQAAPGAQFRLLDAVYSAAIRAQVPTEIVGEMIAMMAQVHDLDGFAAEGDRMTMILAKGHGAGGQMAGQLLFVGVDGPSGSHPCYVVPRDSGPGFRCHAPGARVVAAEGAGLAMTMPVNGTVRRKFVPQGTEDADPDALPGIEFAAAGNSPVTAAAGGVIASIGDDKGALGLNVTIDHGGGMVTRYGWLSALAEGLKQGDTVGGGDTIGRVGTPPDAKAEAGLIFQTLRAGTAVDPMPLLSGGVTVLASDAVETMIGRIIRVESGGNARAKNPLSSATGLGQFIDSTWMRMMRTYRPDLAASLPVSDLLALRFDPALSREMVKHLAQENEAYLRSRGHAISAGRLYLAHFLGPEGAHRVLSSQDGQTVLAVMGGGVVGANPFLAGYTVADLKGWADRKMTSAPVAAATPVPEQEKPASPAVMAFVNAMDDLLKEAEAL